MHFWLRFVYFKFRIIIYSFVCQFSLHFLLILLFNQKQSFGYVLQWKCFNKFHKIYKQTSMLESHFQWSCTSTASNFVNIITAYKRDSGTDFFFWILRNFSEHLFQRTPLEPFCLIAHSVYCHTTTFHLLKKMSHVFSSWVLSQPNLQTEYKSEPNISTTYISSKK